MLQNSQTRPRRLIFMITVIVALLLAALGVYGLINSPNRQTSTPAMKTATSSPSGVASATPPMPSSGTTTAPVASQVINTTDPEAFARAAATALFNWDTTVGYQPADLAQALVAVGDPTGVETGLASDVRNYVPTNYDWNYLRTYQTKQWLSIKRLYVPRQWATALAQAKPGQLRPGTVAYTITGIRHRSGIWLTQRISTKHSVAFTLIITCRPTFGTCRLLRVGKLNSPLN